MVTWKKEIRIPADTAAMIRNCGDKVGVGKAIAGGMNYQNELTVNAIQARLSGTGYIRGSAGPLTMLRSITGHLKRSMQRTDALLITDTEGAQVRSAVGSNVRIGGDAVSYAAPLEFGSKPHPITPKLVRGPRAMLRFVGSDGKIHFAKQVNHPGNPPFAFVRGTVTQRLPAYGTDLGGRAFKFLTGGNN